MIAVLIIVFGMVLISVFAFWLAIAVALEDFTVPIRSKFPFKKVLVVFPHPDDEISVAGFIHRLSKRGTHTTLLLLTKGERGTHDASLQTPLKKIRSLETKHSVKHIGFTTLLMEDMGDGQLKKKKILLQRKIQTVMSKVKPDLVITYDPSGLYGHPDHMIVADVLTDRMRNKSKNTTLWYIVFSEYMLGAIRLPTHMATDKRFMSLRVPPTHKIWIGSDLLAKLRALYAHKSQLTSFKKATAMFFMPPWFLHSTRMFEYFAEFNPKKRSQH